MLRKYAPISYVKFPASAMRSVKRMFSNILWLAHCGWADLRDIMYHPPNLLTFEATKIPLRLLLLMGSQGIWLLMFARHRSIDIVVINITYSKSQVIKDPWDLVLVTTNEGDKMCSNHHFKISNFTTCLVCSFCKQRKGKHWTFVSIDLGWEFQPKSIAVFIRKQKGASIKQEYEAMFQDLAGACAMD